ncbi:C1 family peptidase [Nibrella viscosa]
MQKFHCFLFGGLLLLTVAAWAESPKGVAVSKVYAVLVGVDKIAAYKDVPPVMAAEDLANVRKFLEKQTMGVIFNPDQIVTLLNEQATNDNVRKALQKAFKEADSDDKVVLYYSGRGLASGQLLLNDYSGPIAEARTGQTRHLVAKADSFIVLRAKQVSQPGELSLGEINELLASSNAGQVQVWIDACYAGAWVKPQLLPKSSRKSLHILASSYPDELSFSDMTPKGGRFTNRLLEALAGSADYDRNREVTVGEAMRYVTEKAYGTDQHPQLHGSYRTSDVMCELPKDYYGSSAYRPSRSISIWPREGRLKGLLPTSFSLRAYMPTIGDQGETGTDVAWAVCYARTIMEARRQKLAGQQEAIDALRFSPTYIYAQIKASTDTNCQNGARPSDALLLVQDRGAVLATDLPNADCNVNVAPYHERAAQYRIGNSWQLPADKIPADERIYRMKQALVETNNALVIGMMIPRSFMQAGEFWKPASEENLQNAVGGHALVVVGYDDNKNGGSFLLANSWGTGWGQQGYTWVRYNDLTHFTPYAYCLTDPTQ